MINKILPIYELRSFNCDILGQMCELSPNHQLMDDTHKPNCEECWIYLENQEKIDIGNGFKIPKDMLDEYSKYVVNMLRKVMKEPITAMALDPLYIYNLELRRKELHDQILVYLGIPRDTDNEQYIEFSSTLEKYLEEIGVGLYNN